MIFSYIKESKRSVSDAFSDTDLNYKIKIFMSKQAGNSADKRESICHKEGYFYMNTSIIHWPAKRKLLKIGVDFLTYPGSEWFPNESSVCRCS